MLVLVCDDRPQDVFDHTIASVFRTFGDARGRNRIASLEDLPVFFGDVGSLPVECVSFLTVDAAAVDDVLRWVSREHFAHVIDIVLVDVEWEINGIPDNSAGFQFVERMATSRLLPHVSYALISQVPNIVEVMQITRMFGRYRAFPKPATDEIAAWLKEQFQIRYALPPLGRLLNSLMLRDALFNLWHDVHGDTAFAWERISDGVAERGRSRAEACVRAQSAVGFVVDALQPQAVSSERMATYIEQLKQYVENLSTDAGRSARKAGASVVKRVDEFVDTAPHPDFVSLGGGASPGEDNLKAFLPTAWVVNIAEELRARANGDVWRHLFRVSSNPPLGEILYMSVWRNREQWTIDSVKRAAEGQGWRDLATFARVRLFVSDLETTGPALIEILPRGRIMMSEDPKIIVSRSNGITIGAGERAVTLRWLDAINDTCSALLFHIPTVYQFL